jgi:nucleoside-diphosphate-sugar epimerase
MKVLITGGGGFLGMQLARAILRRGHLIGERGVAEEVVGVRLFDARFAGEAFDARVEQMVGDMGDRDSVSAAVGPDPDVAVFHLASMVSGECELRFDDALRVNLDGGRYLFEAVRALPGLQRVVFASSIACFGGEAMRDPNTDHTKLTPQTTYGMTKAMCELMINDYSRKGFFDGRSARLPTVIIRPGRPNAAASSWASGMFREPLAGEECRLPVRREQRHPMTGYRTVVESLIAMHELAADAFGADRAVGLPAMEVTPAVAAAVLDEVAAERGLLLGRTVDAPDERIQGIVDRWPLAVDGDRGAGMGLPRPPSLKVVVEQYLEDFGG